MSYKERLMTFGLFRLKEAQRKPHCSLQLSGGEMEREVMTYSPCCPTSDREQRNLIMSEGLFQLSYSIHSMLCYAM